MNKLTNFFLEGFPFHEANERRLAGYLLTILLAMCCFFTLGLFNHLFWVAEVPLLYVGDMIGILGMLLALFTFRQKHVQRAGTITVLISINSMFFFNTFSELFYNTDAYQPRVYRTLVALIGLFFVVLAFQREQNKIWLFAGVSAMVMFLHCGMIYWRAPDPQEILQPMVEHLLIALVSILLTTIVSVNILGYLDELLLQREKDSSQIHDQNVVLESLVKQRTRALSSSNDRLQEFAHIVSHDLKEPLRTISGFVTLIEHAIERGETNSEALRENLRYVKRGTVQMDALIADILSYSKLNVGEHTLVEVSMNQVMDEAGKQVSSAIMESHAEFDIAYLPRVRGAERLLVQLMQNLISNAIKYRDSSRPLLIRVWSEPEGENMVRIYLSDNGIGIAPEYFDTIFVAFKRLHTKTEYEGTGVGLAICKKVVEIHGGEIRVQSKVGEGATFSFTLPKA